MSCLDIPQIAKEKGCPSWSTEWAVADKTSGRPEQFSIRTEAQWNDWHPKFLATNKLSLIGKIQFYPLEVSKSYLLQSHYRIHHKWTVMAKIYLFEILHICTFIYLIAKLCHYFCNKLIYLSFIQ